MNLHVLSRFTFEIIALVMFYRCILFARGERFTDESLRIDTIINEQAVLIKVQTPNSVKSWARLIVSHHLPFSKCLGLSRQGLFGSFPNRTGDASGQCPPYIKPLYMHAATIYALLSRLIDTYMCWGLIAVKLLKLWIRISYLWQLRNQVVFVGELYRY